jgi:hypothetical protein
MGVGGSTSHPGRIPASIGGVFVGPRTGLDGYRRRQDMFRPTGIEPRSIQSVESRYSGSGIAAPITVNKVQNLQAYHYVTSLVFWWFVFGNLKILLVLIYKSQLCKLSLCFLRIFFKKTQFCSSFEFIIAALWRHKSSGIWHRVDWWRVGAALNLHQGAGKVVRAVSTSALVSCELSHSKPFAFSARKDFRYPLSMRLSGVERRGARQTGLNDREKEKNLLSLPGINLSVVQHFASTPYRNAQTRSLRSAMPVTVCQLKGSPQDLILGFLHHFHSNL